MARTRLHALQGCCLEWMYIVDECKRGGGQAHAVKHSLLDREIERVANNLDCLVLCMTWSCVCWFRTWADAASAYLAAAFRPSAVVETTTVLTAKVPRLCAVCLSIPSGCTPLPRFHLAHGRGPRGKKLPSATPRAH